MEDSQVAVPENPLVWKWDKWQQKVLETKGDIAIRAGRQVGKSEVISSKAANFASDNHNTVTLVIAASQRQSSLLFEKIRAKVDKLVEERKCQYSEKPTLTRICMTNGSRIYCLPTGRTGYFIRGFTIDLLIADEAAYIPESVWNAVVPMIAVSRKKRKLGNIIMLSTPFGKGGYFYDSFFNPKFKHFHASSEKCTRIPKSFLKRERQRMTKQEYRQEYLAEFSDEWNQFFSTDLIKKCMVLNHWSFMKDYKREWKYYLGVDVARYGGDENAFVILEISPKYTRVIQVRTTERVSTVDTIHRIVDMDNKFNFRKVFIDDAGLGGAITDVLQDELGRKVVGLNNAQKRIEVQGEEKQRGILKEDLYSNVLNLMETSKIQLLHDLDLMKSMKSITFQYGGTKDNNMKRLYLFGKYTHLTEALVRACWSVKEKGLNIYRY